MVARLLPLREQLLLLAGVEVVEHLLIIIPERLCPALNHIQLAAQQQLVLLELLQLLLLPQLAAALPLQLQLLSVVLARRVAQGLVERLILKEVPVLLVLLVDQPDRVMHHLGLVGPHL
jgi:hypothetical protein